MAQSKSKTSKSIKDPVADEKLSKDLKNSQLKVMLIKNNLGVIEREEYYRETNENKIYHRKSGEPALTERDPMNGNILRQEWRVDGLLHCKGGHALFLSETKYPEANGGSNKNTFINMYAWYEKGNLHRMDGPARILTHQTEGYTLEEWFHEGRGIKAEIKNGKQVIKRIPHHDYKNDVFKTLQDIRAVLNNRGHYSVDSFHEFLAVNSEKLFELKEKGGGNIFSECCPGEVEVDKDSISFLDNDGCIHGVPAYLKKGSEIISYEHGKVHWKNGPAKISLYSYEEWYENDKVHRKNGPAKIEINGTQSWYENGKLKDRVYSPQSYLDKILRGKKK